MSSAPAYKLSLLPLNLDLLYLRMSLALEETMSKPIYAPLIDNFLSQYWQVEVMGVLFSNKRL